jgi:hypothetical protein
MSKSSDTSEIWKNNRKSRDKILQTIMNKIATVVAQKSQFILEDSIKMDHDSYWYSEKQG